MARYSEGGHRFIDRRTWNISPEEYKRRNAAVSRREGRQTIKSVRYTLLTQGMSLVLRAEIGSIGGNKYKGYIILGPRERIEKNRMDLASIIATSGVIAIRTDFDKRHFDRDAAIKNSHYRLESNEAGCDAFVFTYELYGTRMPEPLSEYWESLCQGLEKKMVMGKDIARALFQKVIKQARPCQTIDIVEKHHPVYCFVDMMKEAGYLRE